MMLGLSKHHDALGQLCRRLELIADSLPDDHDPQECLLLSRTIYPVVKSAHDFEENVVFSMLQQSKLHNQSLEQSLERLRFEHWEDESFAMEVSDGLVELVSGNLAYKQEQLGYMLRGFFEGMRRHIAFEVEHLVPILGQHFDQAGG